ncbi:MAG TPA: AAA family ATPase [Bryobacteraceae bacterium]
MPLLTVFGGPNGSGKSSVIRKMEFEGRENLLDTDAIAKRMDPANPRRAAVAAGREVILRTREYLGNQQSFAIETTLSSRSSLTTICEAQERGFIVHLVYVCVNTPERSIQRVRERVTEGGHDVPEEDVRRRYVRSLQNLPAVLLQAHKAVVYDNSDDEPRKVLETQAGIIVWRADCETAWVTRVCEIISSKEPT